MDYKDFTSEEFPPVQRPLPRRAVYVLFWVDEAGEIPFYVGQTVRFEDRMQDYVTASFSACTDFRVGRAIRYLRDTQKRGMVVKYKRATKLREEERKITRTLLLEGKRLFNPLPSYDYHGADEMEEERVVQKFCDTLLEVAEKPPGLSS